ncbi:MAG: phosphoribosyl-ATP diphosphatase [Alphaproteobacteria bacterium]|nr:phosphoribosyl-ATP diphosphatase [Candidatus Fonsibacter sp. PEL55]
MFFELIKLIRVIKKNKNKNPKISYTANLIKKGKNFCIKKFSEEAKEFAISSKYSNKKNIVYEAADLLYHFLVLLEFKKISIFLVMKELKRRQKISGMEEKKNRKKNVR